jgi:RNA 3'-terminal phosphate cyclase (ATP)
MSAAERVEIDGSFGEGGGQILRTSLALSLLTGRPFRVINIRAGRPKPGLQPQHLMSVRAAAQVGQAAVIGDQQGSQELVFEPGEVVAGKYHFGISTAGATGLVLQTIYLPLALRGGGPSEVVITGGTHVAHAPCYHFLEITWRHFLAAMGLGLKLKMRRPGFYPRGGGLIEGHITPAATVQPLPPWDETGNDDVTITGFSAVAGLPLSIAERQARRAETRLKRERLNCEIEVQTWEGGPGTVLGLVLPSAPAPVLFFGLGQRGKPAERVADEAADQLLDHCTAGRQVVDPHSADQIVLPLALAAGPSSYGVSCITQHLLTNVAVIRKFIEREVRCEGEEGSPGRVVID